MSEEIKMHCCLAGLSATCADGLTRLGVDWTKVWALVQKFGPEVLKILEVVLPLLIAGKMNWSELLSMLSSLFPTPPQPAPVP
jgi:hypothetical protein